MYDIKEIYTKEERLHLVEVFTSGLVDKVIDDSRVKMLGIADEYKIDRSVAQKVWEKRLRGKFEV